MKLLVLGGYGAFGARLVQLLADTDALEILVCGRNEAKAREVCERLSSTAILTPLRLDRTDIVAALAQQRPDIVVDATGPFQDYGDDPYAVVRACLEAGVNYLDFADAADFVAGIQAFDATAREKSLFVLSGVSSFPVLTAAVVNALGRDMTVLKVRGGIAPSPHAGIGLNVMRAVLGYAGAPVRLMRGGRESRGTGLAESMRYTIAPPGALPLRNTRFSLVDVPDLRIVPREHPTITDIWIGAGPVPESLHRILNGLAGLRARLRLPSLAPLARICHRILNMTAFGEHRGGMFVEAEGLRDGKAVTRSWHMLAEGDDGPLVPSMAIEGVVRKALSGNPPPPGARAATGALSLADYDRLFARRRITTGFREEPDTGTSLFARILGSAFDGLPPEIAALHQPEGRECWAGTASVERGTGLPARLVAALFGFPPSSAGTPVRVEIETVPEGERWTRTFGDATFSSLLQIGKGRNSRLVTERFGPVSVALALVIEDGRLLFIPRRWSVLGLPMPGALLPRGISFESVRDGRFHFDVTIAAPLVGLISTYSGYLSRAPKA